MKTEWPIATVPTGNHQPALREYAPKLRLGEAVRVTSFNSDRLWIRVDARKNRGLKFVSVYPHEYMVLRAGKRIEGRRFKSCPR